MSKECVWVGKEPTCDVCEHIEGVKGVEAVVDGKTNRGPWALMCERHFDTHGMGLGTGRGQRLVKRKGASDG